MNFYRHLTAHASKILDDLAANHAKRVYNLSLPHFALLLSCYPASFIAVEDSDESATALYNDLMFFKQMTGTAGDAVSLFPPASSPELIGQRASVLLKSSCGENIGIITSPEACATGLQNRNITDKVFTIGKGLPIERNDLRAALAKLGYRNVSVVMEKGEYSQREWIFDIYPTTEDMPVRVEFFGDEIEIIRSFDIETQRSIREVQKMELFPASEDEPLSTIIDELAIDMDPGVFISESASIPVFSRDTECNPVFVSHMPFEGDGVDAMERSVKGMGILPEERKELGDIPAALTKTDSNTLIVLSSEAQADRLKNILFEGGVIAPLIRTKDITSHEGGICITVGTLSSGIGLNKIMVLTDRELFGERPAYRPIKKARASRLLFSIDDVKAGDLVVHKDHGVGRFTGLQRQTTDGCEEDLITIEYAHGDRLYIPFYSIDKLQKYSGGEGHTPPIERLGSRKWQKTKRRVGEKVREMAEKLLKIYAERRVSRGFVFTEDTTMHKDFDDFFPYDETPDQIKAFEEIQKHMHSETPMDMLLCGDVGYGKTEVAIKAAFRAVFDGKQVAILVPTTLLAEQHFRTFKIRFSAFPVKIDYLSRFKDKEAVSQTIKAMSVGEVDIVVGTHMLLNKKVEFSDLGLLIIDEEHRFGVAQKERLKELKRGVDVLTLTATPIPRTLHMALAGIREIATIETPPEERLAVKSVVTPFNAKTLKEAMERELKRDGQIFFVHNRINDIEKTAGLVKELAPFARISVAHGQMKEAELENIMLGFMNHNADILVCTAIIGSGIDIPTANTIIVDRADTFGLADLYQLRGRVGRGNIQAYAYFLLPDENALTDDARKRLQAIQEMSYLGAGFRLALKDLDIRGAGNLLGAEQSGCIHGVGFDMYMDMLEKAVAELKGLEVAEEIEPTIQLRLSAFIPDDYLSDISLRLSIYKRISSLKSTDALDTLREELADRFGSLPEEALNLLQIIKIKLLAKRLYITKTVDTGEKCRFFFLVDPENAYKMPEDFFDRLMKVLFSFSSRGSIKFFPDGFELDTRNLEAREAVERIEKTLLDIIGQMS